MDKEGWAGHHVDEAPKDCGDQGGGPVTSAGIAALGPPKMLVQWANGHGRERSGRGGNGVGG